MKTTVKFAFIVMAVIVALSPITAMSQENPTPEGFPPFDPAKIYQEMDLENLVRAYNDLHPEAAFMALWNSYFKEGSTEQNIGLMETSVDSRQIVLTANSETIYAVHPVELNAQGGAVVVEVPPGVLGMANAPGWTEITDIGPMGPDKSKGGKYLFTSPQFKGKIPSGYFHFKSPANTIVWLLRGFVVDGDTKATVRFLQKNIKTYSLKDAKNPPPTTFYNTSESTTNGKNMDMIHSKEDVFPLIKQYFKLNNGGDAKHAYIRGHLYAMGFFDETLDSSLLKKATDIGDVRQRTLTFNNRAKDALKWPGKSNWEWANNFSDEFYTGRTSGYYSPDQHQVWTYQATFTSIAMTRPPQGVGSQYIIATKDDEGEWLNGSKHYSLVIPANVPAENFWSIIAYDTETRSMVQNDDFQWGVNSYADDLELNKDGSVTLHFAPKKPEGINGRNWIQTIPGDGFFLWFRTYSPTETWYDNTWVLPNMICIKN